MKDLIKRILGEYLNEVRVINIGGVDFFNEKPIKDDESIRVYHGFNYFDDVLFVLLYGLSGKEKAARIYSYEHGNNPKGLFVTINFDKAKYFAGGGVIIEFSTKAYNLEAPVWVGGRSYYVQGEYTQSFKDDEDREEQRLKNREKYLADLDPRISKSDRPELGQTLFGNYENQALFIGDLDPNMIKYVWYNERKRYMDNKFEDKWIRYSRKEFVKKFESDKTSAIIHGDKFRRRSSRLFKPNEDFNEDIFIKRLESEHGKGAYDRWIKYELGDKFSEYWLDSYFWDKQMKQAKEFYKNKFPDLNTEQ